MGKHALLLVPNYDSEGQDVAPLTYLRLGAAFEVAGELLNRAERGDEHLDGFAWFESASEGEAPGEGEPPSETNAEGETTDESEASVEPPLPIFDTTGIVGSRYGAFEFRDDGSQLPSITDDATLTGQLLTRGGIREHTDGNRISTTRGDCIEVVGGNYKLIVMGRVKGPHVNTPHAAQWKSAGGILHDVTATPGAGETVSVKWTPTDDGTWEVTEQTEKGEVYTNIVGRMEDIFTGTSRIRYPGHGGAEQNPEEAERPTITERTYARQITSVTRIDGPITETTRIEGNLTETVKVTGALAALVERTEVSDPDGYLRESTGTEEEKVGSYTSRSFSGIVLSYEQFEKEHEIEEGNWTNSISLGLEAQVSVGTKLELHYDQVAVDFALGASFETALAVKAEASLAATVDAKLGMFTEVSLKAEDEEATLFAMIDHGIESLFATAEVRVSGVEFRQEALSTSS
ncbi:MAG: hypothetical protein FJ096_11020 [Deltaproteobacteria bacterium]|nr:hypothetical protein [Deltaproteobacteria bacterium]